MWIKDFRIKPDTLLGHIKQEQPGTGSIQFPSALEADPVAQHPELILCHITPYTNTTRSELVFWEW